MNNDSAPRPTVLVDHYRKAALVHHTNVHYQGLPIHALPGLHEFAFAQFSAHCPSGAMVLELAAGSGAMSQRLADAGYRVTATDYLAENFRLHERLPFFTCDLNGDFANGRDASQDAVCALEIIEHLENPRHFFRQCYHLLKPGGILLISTPNLDNAASLTSFLRGPSFQWFSDADYERDGHITPLSQWQILKCVAESGFHLAWQGSFGDPFEWLRGSPRMLLLSKALAALMVRAPTLRQQIYLALLRKPV
jgi:SAM-dependent methyltransferase